jgi:hypothetical protein
MTSGRKITLDRKVSTSVSLELEVIQLMDNKRGQESRSSFINRVVKVFCGTEA